MRKAGISLVLGSMLGVLTFLAAAPLSAQELTPPLVIRGGILIDGTGNTPRKDITIVIQEGKIQAIGPEVKIPEGATQIDATGKYIVPGLIDLRVRIGPTPANHVSRSEVSVEQRLESLRALLAAGVTTARLIQGDLAEQKLYQRWWKEKVLVSPRIVTSGPVFTAKGGHPTEEYSLLAWEARDRETRQITDEDQARAKAREITHADVNSLEVNYDKGPTGNIKPRLDKSLLHVLIEEGHGFDLPVFCEVGTDDEANEAVASGADVLEGIWEEALAEATPATIANRHVFFVPALTQQGDVLNLLDPATLKAYLEEPIVQRSLSTVIKQSLANQSGVIGRLGATLNGPAGEMIRKELAEQQKRAFENVRKAKAAGVGIAVGTGSGSLLVFPGAAVHREMQLLVKAGLTPMEAILAATRNAAASLGKSDELGTIEQGKSADLLILSADPLADIRNTEKIEKVIQDGREISEKDLQLR